MIRSTYVDISVASMPEKINRPLKVYFVQGGEVTFGSAFDL